MVFSYYPGCTLKNKAKNLDLYGRKSAEKLGIELKELDDWQCCGGVYPQSTDEVAVRLSAVRALKNASDRETSLVTLCSACHQVLKRANEDIQTDENFRNKANAYSEFEYNGETEVIHYLEMLRDKIGFDELKKAVVNPLKGRKIGAYYGCLLLRPNKVMQFDNPENPKIIEDFIKALGAEPVIYPYRNECCGGYTAANKGNDTKGLCGNIVNSAVAHGAEELITACPLCLYNLEKNNGGNVPVKYFTELLAEALGIKEECDNEL